jgi:hypothetical protein
MYQSENIYQSEEIHYVRCYSDISSTARLKAELIRVLDLLYITELQCNLT